MRWLLVLVVFFLPKTTFSQTFQFSEDARFFLVGDSFTNGFTDWARRVDMLPPFEMDVFSVGGRSLLDMQSAFETNFIQDQYDAVVIAGGVNDVIRGRNAAEMLSSLIFMIAETNGEPIILTTIAPFRGRANIWTQARQDIADEFDDIVRQLAADSDNISLFDVRSILDADDDEAIDPLITVDNLHPTICPLTEECGMSLLADAFISQFLAGDVLLGDVDQNGLVNFFDIPPLINLFSTGDFQVEADCNEDGFVNFIDIPPFIMIITNS